MIPTAETIIAAVRGEFPRIDVNEKAIRAAVQHARELARWPLDEPAALFFAFAIRPRAIPLLNASLAPFLALEQVLDLAILLRAERAELKDLQRRCRMREVTFEDVRAWFAERMPID